jgi:hypothetical protein
MQPAEVPFPGGRACILAWIHSTSTRTAHCPLQAAFYCVISAFYGGLLPNMALCSPVWRSLQYSPGLRFCSNTLLIKYKPTTVASTRECWPLLPPPCQWQLALVCPHQLQVACWLVFHIGAHCKQALHVGVWLALEQT